MFVAFEIRANTEAVRGATIQGIADQYLEHHRLRGRLWRATLDDTLEVEPVEFVEHGGLVEADSTVGERREESDALTSHPQRGPELREPVHHPDGHRGSASL